MSWIGEAHTNSGILGIYRDPTMITMTPFGEPLVGTGPTYSMSLRLIIILVLCSGPAVGAHC